MKHRDFILTSLPTDEKVTHADYCLGDDEAERRALERMRARMAWLDDQDHEFRALVHGVGLNQACRRTGRRLPNGL